MAKPDAPLILVVDDESHIARLIQFFLEKAGYRVTIAGDGESALRTLEREACSAVLLDLVLPGISGIDVLRQIRRDARLAHLPVIVLSARSFADGQRELQEAGATAQCAKPVAPSLLLDRLSELGLGVAR